MVVAGIRTSRGDERRRVLVAKGAAGVAWFALMAMSVACQEGPDERRDATVKEVPGDPPDDGGTWMAPPLAWTATRPVVTVRLALEGAGETEEVLVRDLAFVRRAPVVESELRTAP